jgi:hypothetical protein
VWVSCITLYRAVAGTGPGLELMEEIPPQMVETRLPKVKQKSAITVRVAPPEPVAVALCDKRAERSQDPAIVLELARFRGGFTAFGLIRGVALVSLR